MTRLEQLNVKFVELRKLEKDKISLEQNTNGGGVMKKQTQKKNNIFFHSCPIISLVQRLL